MYSWNKVDKYFFLSEPANFSTSDRLGRNLPTAQNCPRKGKTFIQLNRSQNKNGQLKKGI